MILALLAVLGVVLLAGLVGAGLQAYTGHQAIGAWAFLGALVVGVLYVASAL